MVLWAVASLSVAYLPWSDHPRPHIFPGQPWFEAWVHWDSLWYREIANHGYSYRPGRQSAVAFFPLYPLTMRAGGALCGSSLLAGIVVTAASGAASAAMVWTWCHDRMSDQAAWTALALFLVWPYAYYLYGAVYADALFVGAALAAFLLLESDHLWLAGLAGALATAARPVGLVVVVGLTVRALERRGVLPWSRVDGRLLSPHRGAGASTTWGGTVAMAGRAATLVDLGQVRRGDSAILVSAGGLGAYCVYLATRFGHPLLFVQIERYWGQAPGPHAWLKFEFLDQVTNLEDPWSWFAHIAHLVVVVVAMALVPRVFRRFGWGYGIYSLLAVGVAAVSTKDFFGCGRYVLAAFPCFAAAGELLVDRPWLRSMTLTLSASALVVMTSLFARGAYLS